METNESTKNNVFKTPISRQRTMRCPSNVQNGAKPLITKLTQTASLNKEKKESSKLTRKDSNLKSVSDLSDKLQNQLFLTDDYFNAKHGCGGSKRALKSGKTMASLGAHRLTPDQASLLLGKLPPPPCAAAIDDRVGEIVRDVFPKMAVQLRAGHDVLLYGYGSKLALLNSFHERYLRSEDSMVIDGFSTEVTIQTILNKIIETFVPGLKVTQRNPRTTAESIRDHYEAHGDTGLYLVVHNIDGPSLRNSADIFSVLTDSSAIRIIASVDHIHSPIMWNSCSRMRWLWHDCTTLSRYSTETRVSQARLMSDKAQRGITSLAAVLASLNPQAKAVFMHLAQYQLEHRCQGWEGMNFNKLFSVCKESLLVTSEFVLRTHLVEFRDHRLIVFSQGLDRSDFIKIALEESSVRDFVENFSE